MQDIWEHQDVKESEDKFRTESKCALPLGDGKHPKVQGMQKRRSQTNHGMLGS